jgi:pilus assembly protein CpaC
MITSKRNHLLVILFIVSSCFTLLSNVVNADTPAESASLVNPGLTTRALTKQFSQQISNDSATNAAEEKRLADNHREVYASHPSVHEWRPGPRYKRTNSDSSRRDSLIPKFKVIFLKKDQGFLLPVRKDLDTIFIANPAISDFTVKHSGLLYMTGNKIGATDLYGVSSSGETMMHYKVRVGYDIERIREIIRRFAPGSHVRIEQVDDNLMLSGMVNTATQVADIKRVLGKFVTSEDNILSLLKVKQASQVYLRVRLVEVSRDINNTLGVTWNAIFNSGSFSVGTSFVGANDNQNINNNNLVPGGRGLRKSVDVVINAMASEGLANILSEPNLTTMTGQTANFHAGGEFPIPVSQSALGNTTIEFRRFGISLEFTPTVINQDTINLSVHPSVSEISTSGGVSTNGFNVPALVTREANTTVELKSGQSFAIAGLIQNNMSQALSKYPGLAEVPILGQLFTSRNYMMRKTELVIVVTPYLVKPIDSKDVQFPATDYQEVDGVVSNYQNMTSKTHESTGFVLY